MKRETPIPHPKCFQGLSLGLALALAALAAACAPGGAPASAPAVQAATEAPTPLLLAATASFSTPEPEVGGPPAGLGALPFPTPMHFVFPTAGPRATPDWRPPPYPVPWAVRPEDHFYFTRPIPSGEVNWPNPNYRYGTTFFGEEPIHTGVDLGAKLGTAVLAAAPGEVVWVGYGLYRGIEDVTDPYGLAVALRHDFGYQGQTLYTVYAHMRSTSVWFGQRVEAGEQIGAVGNTGHASGPHLHFEVRLGDNRFFSTRNPELWMAPPEGWGVLAGRITNNLGTPLEEYLVHITNQDTEQQWDVWTYAKGTVHPDDAYEENFVISDLPSGPYQVYVSFSGKPYIANLWIYPGQTNLVAFKGVYGFTVEPTPTASAP